MKAISLTAAPQHRSTKNPAACPLFLSLVIRSQNEEAHHRSFHPALRTQASARGCTAPSSIGKPYVQDNHIASDPWK